MEIDKPNRGARLERLLRGMLGLALLAAAAWALLNGGADPQGFYPGSLTPG